MIDEIKNINKVELFNIPKKNKLTFFSRLKNIMGYGEKDRYT
jgi:hypothetical protein